MKMIRSLAIAVAIGGFATATHAADRAAVVETYADIAHAMYEDSLLAAELMEKAVDAFVADPSEASLRKARTAWLFARVPYQQTEGFRFGNSIVDDWEGKVNAWPLDEGLIDYVDASYGTDSDENLFYTANIIANPKVTVGGQTVDAGTIDKALLKALHEIDGVEANVATGYHAIEFLLWGQDLNGVGAGAGDRPYTDFDPANCTGGACARRAAYLTAATDLLLEDLREIVAAWAPGGAARATVTSDPDAGVAAIVTGLGSLSYGELAGERMKLGLMLHDPEEEHDCFADNTHNSHYYNQVGMMVIYTGRYARTDGTVVAGQALADLVVADDTSLHTTIASSLDRTLDAMQVMKDTADLRLMSYDQMIGADNPTGNRIIEDVVRALVTQAKGFEQAVAALGLARIEFEGSDSLDNPSAVFE